MICAITFRPSHDAQHVLPARATGIITAFILALQIHDLALELYVWSPTSETSCFTSMLLCSRLSTSVHASRHHHSYNQKRRSTQPILYLATNASLANAKRFKEITALLDAYEQRKDEISYAEHYSALSCVCESSICG